VLSVSESELLGEYKKCDSDFEKWQKTRKT